MFVFDRVCESTRRLISMCSCSTRNLKEGSSNVMSGKRLNILKRGRFYYLSAKERRNWACLTPGVPGHTPALVLGIRSPRARTAPVELSGWCMRQFFAALSPSPTSFPCGSFGKGFNSAHFQLQKRPAPVGIAERISLNDANLCLVSFRA